MTVDELKAKIEKLPLPPEEPKRFTWDFRRASLREKILEDDPLNFLRWPVIEETMFVGNAPYIDEEYVSLMGQPGWRRWADAIDEVDFGNPETLPEPFDWTSGNLVHQAYHLQTWEMNSHKRVQDLDFIFEFGGGYGAMAMICRRLGFEGTYVIYDLPEFLLLQEFYLSNVLPEEQFKRIRFLNKYEAQTEKAIYDLLIACCSISEVPLDLQQDFLSRIKTDHHLIVYQPKWDGNDNHKLLTEHYPNSVKFDNPNFTNNRFCVC